jgi:hypothetical protein
MIADKIKNSESSLNTKLILNSNKAGKHYSKPISIISKFGPDSRQSEDL